jgi:hypothetical protein
MRKKCQKDIFTNAKMFCFKIKEQFLHLDPDLDTAAQINADPCVSGNRFGPATLLFISVSEGPGAFSGIGIRDEKKSRSRIQDEHPGTYF